MQTKCSLCGVEWDPEIQKHNSPGDCTYQVVLALRKLWARVDALFAVTEKGDQKLKDEVARLDKQISHLARRVFLIEHPKAKK